MGVGVRMVHALNTENYVCVCVCGVTVNSWRHHDCAAQADGTKKPMSLKITADLLEGRRKR